MKRTIDYEELKDTAINYVECDSIDSVSPLRRAEYLKKGKFVWDLNKLLVRRGEGRYDWLDETPIRYAVFNNSSEYLVTPWCIKNVTINSLPLICVEFMKIVLE